MRKLKIGLFCDTYFPMIDGVVMVVDNYARRLQQYGEVTVFVPGDKRKHKILNELPYPVVTAPAIKVPATDYSLPVPEIDYRFSSAIKKADLDLIHIHSPFSIGNYALRFGRRNKIPVVATLHSQFRRDFQRALRLDSTAELLLKGVIRIFNDCDECWAVNAAIADIFQEYGCRPLPGVQENGTDLLPVPDLAAACRLVNETYGIAPDETVLLFVGRLNKLKNVFLIADALHVLKARGVRFKMLFVGAGQDEDALKKHVADLDLNDRIIFTGRVKERELISAIYARAALFLFPSFYDASSLVQIEAASQKTPSVFAEGAATADTITPGVNGFVAPPDAEGYADTVANILADPQNLRKVSENAFADLYRSWDDIVERVYHRYLDLCERYEAKKEQ